MALFSVGVCAQQTATELHLFVVADGGIASLERQRYATLPEALAKARVERKTQTNRAIRITLEAGRHALTETLVLTPEDSGASPASPLVIEGTPGKETSLVGGTILKGWKLVDAAARRSELELPEVKNGSWYFRSLYINGHRATRARTPNTGFFRIQGPSPTDHPVQIRYQGTDIKPGWTNTGDVELIALLSWADLRMAIRSVDEGKHIATLSGNPQPSNQESDARYYIENTPDALDAPGEWYLDRKSGRVSYLAKAGEDFSKEVVTAPRLKQLMRWEGDFASQKAVRNILVRGLTFAETDWNLAPEGYADVQAAVHIRGDLLLRGVEDCSIEDCTFRGLGGYAVELGEGCRRVRVVGNEMTELAAGGVRVGEGGGSSTGFTANNSHEISQNHIHHNGVIYPPAAGVFILQSGANRVSHNHIHHLNYTAVSVGWTWGYQDSPCRANIVEFNHMHDIGQGRLSDMGAVYTLGPQPGTIIRNNLIHDVDSFTYGGWGLYTDEGSTGIVLENNVVYRCKSAGFHQHYGRDNIIRNNIFALNREAQLMRTREEDHQSFQFTNNIVFFDQGQLFASNWDNRHYAMEGNVYFDTRSDHDLAKIKWGGLSWADWQKAGLDTQSILADPLFVDPMKGDFTLKANSPALALGFKPISLADVGITRKSSSISESK